MARSWGYATAPRRNYADLDAQGRARWGDQWDPSNLSPMFRPYYESGARIEVRFPYGETLRGRVGVTTGYRPVFLLLRTVRSHGSSDLLDGHADVVRVVAV